MKLLPATVLALTLSLSALFGGLLRETNSSASIPPTPNPVASTSVPLTSNLEQTLESSEPREEDKLPKFQHGHPVAGKPVEDLSYMNSAGCCIPDTTKTSKWLASASIYRGHWVFCPNPKRVPNPCSHLALAPNHPVLLATTAAKNKLWGMFGTSNYYVWKLTDQAPYSLVGS